MKTTLILMGTFIVAAGCGTAKMSSRQGSDYPAYAEQRVEGQWAREAGLHEQDWVIRKTNLTEVAEMPQPAPMVAEGGAAQVGQDVTVTAGAAGLEVLDQADVSLHKEEMVVGKREVSNGGVLIRTVVQSEEVKQPVDLRREEYVIERIPAGSARDLQARSENAFQGREIYIPLIREEPVTGKRTLLTEEVRLGKKVETDQKTVTIPVRSEDVQIVKNPDLNDAKFSTVPRHATTAGSLASAGAPFGAETATDSLKLKKEEFLVGKQEIDNGGVYLQKTIHTETASQPVELRREEYTVERKPLAIEVASADFNPRQIQMGLSREEAVPGTRNYVAETVRVRKQMQTDQQIVSGIVRKESAEVVRLPQGAVTGQGGTGIGGQSGITTISETESGGEGMTKDEFLAHHIKTTLAKSEGTIGSPNIQVSAKDGVATLRGTVSSDAEKKQLTKQVEQLSGVRSVKNELKVVRP